MARNWRDSFSKAFGGPSAEFEELGLYTGQRRKLDQGKGTGTRHNDACFPPSTGNDEQHQALNDMGAFGGPGACGWVTQ